MEIFTNFPLWAALIAIVSAQLIKVPIYFIAAREWRPSLAFSTGGMPSSHSAAVTSLTTAVGITSGFDSALFAISAVFAIIVMFDAAGVRRHAGHHAAEINRLVDEFNAFVKEIKNHNKEYTREKLKELLGHQPSEVLTGGIFGILTAIILYHLVF